MVARIRDGAIGQIVAMHVYWTGRGVWEPRRSREQVATEMEYQMRNWYYFNWLSGDHIVEQHVDNLDVACWLMEEHPVSARGMGGRQVRTDERYGDIFDHHAVEYTFEGGQKMFSYCRHQPNTWNLVEERVLGTLGCAHLTNSSRMCHQPYGAQENDMIYSAADDTDPYQAEQELLQTAIRHDVPYNQAEAAALSTMTAILGRMATYSGKEIRWEDALQSEVVKRPAQFSWDALPPTVPDEQGAYPIPVPGATKVL
jgi:myo-inositol 2-dehydrogenase / D-chiro-inositol 1-dehydrogenase